MKRYQLIGKEGKELPIIISSDCVVDFLDLMNWSVSHFKKYTKEFSDAPSLPAKENEQGPDFEIDSCLLTSKALPVSKKHKNDSRTDNARNRAIRAGEFSEEHNVSFNQAFRKLFNQNSTAIYEVYAEEAGYEIRHGKVGRPEPEERNMGRPKKVVEIEIVKPKPVKERRGRPLGAYNKKSSKERKKTRYTQVIANAHLFTTGEESKAKVQADEKKMESWRDEESDDPRKCPYCQQGELTKGEDDCFDEWLDQKVRDIEVMLLDCVRKLDLPLDYGSRVWIRHEDDIHGDEFIDGLPQELFLNDTYFKKVYPRGVEFKSPAYLKNYISNRSLEKFSPEIVIALERILDRLPEPIESFKVLRYGMIAPKDDASWRLYFRQNAAWLGLDYSEVDN